MSITAVLAPTNTGKTHRAVEHMLGHASGMIGLPLRLLAREVYDRVTAMIGESEVALVTGEEKRIPAAPRYWVCTVESMPVGRPVDFVAVDEIQLAAHHQRGHVFTARLLEARGRKETWFLGAETIRPLLHKLVPEARIARYPRLSQLRHAGATSLRSLPPRSAVVAFSVDQVYELAERLRQRRGGVAVVLGALSPRTRNAQVALYQSGEVQYMVATDAIGMGLNLDVDHIAFAALHKFDGRQTRFLEAAELAQIAGRAGRFQADGSFGTLAPLPGLSHGVVRAIESHRFQPLEHLVWRNSELDMRTIDTLVASLSRRPDRPALRLVDHAEDFSALVQLAANAEIRDRARSPEAVALLWEVCQVPDFRKLLEDSHVRLLGELFLQLSGPAGRVDHDWMNRHIARIDDMDGDIDMLMRRIAFIRTWTYISNRGRWVEDAAHFRERTHDIEDRLSDALHARLVQRFVERQRRRRPQRTEPASASAHNPFHKLRELFPAAREGAGPEGAGPKGRVQAIIEAGYEHIRVDAEARIWFGEQAIARMTRGADLLRPEVTLQMPELGPGALTRVRRRLVAWTRDLVAESLAPLRQDAARTLSPAGRGLVYQLEQSLGTIHRGQARAQLQALTREDRDILRALGVQVGARLVYVPALLTSPALTRRVALHAAWQPFIKELPAPGIPSVEAREELAAAAYTAMGYPVFGARAIRADLVERVHGTLATLARRAGNDPFAWPEQIARWLRCPPEAVPDIVASFGYRPLADGRFLAARRRRHRSGRQRA